MPPPRTAPDFRRALNLEYATVAWNVGEAFLAIGLGAVAGSLALSQQPRTTPSPGRPEPHVSETERFRTSRIGWTESVWESPLRHVDLESCATSGAGLFADQERDLRLYLLVPLTNNLPGMSWDIRDGEPPVEGDGAVSRSN